MPRVWAEAQLQSVSGYKRLIGDRSRETWTIKSAATSDWTITRPERRSFGPLAAVNERIDGCASTEAEAKDATSGLPTTRKLEIR
jgi:hypothetical protein